MLALAFLSLNCSTGILYGSFGPLLASTEQQFSTSRAMTSLGMAVISVFFTGLSPIVGILIERLSVRTVMQLGALVSIVGYVGLGTTRADYMAVLLFDAVIGIGTSLLGVVAPYTLVTRWFSRDRAKAMGVVTLPIVLILIPFIIARLLPYVGRSEIYFALAAIFIVIFLLAFLVIEYPEDIGQRAWGEKQESEGEEVVGCVQRYYLTTRQIFSYPVFWIITLGFSCLAAAGTAFTTHLVALGAERQLSPTLASMLLTIYAGAGIPGNFIFGWLADRFTAARTLVGIALGEAMLCYILSRATGLGIFVIAGLLGACAVAVPMIHGAIFSSYFGTTNVSRALGLSYAIKLPLILGATPFAGYLFDRTGSYNTSLLFSSGILFLTAGAICIAIYLPDRNGRSLAIAEGIHLQAAQNP